MTSNSDDYVYSLDLHFDPFVHFHQKLSQRSMTDRLEMLTAREQLMEDIDAIVDEFTFDLPIDNIHERSELAEELSRILCDAVCRNFPTN